MKNVKQNLKSKKMEKVQKFNYHFNYIPPAVRVNEDTEELTIPGQALSVTQVMNKLRAGMMIPKNQGLYDFEKGIIPRLTIRSLADLYEAKKELKDLERSINERKETIANKRKMNAAKRKEDDKVEAVSENVKE